MTPDSETAPTGFFLHPESSRHDTGWGHPEHQGRLPAIASALGADLRLLHDKVEQREAEAAGREELERAHSAEHLAVVEGACARAARDGKLVALDPSTVVSGGSWPAATGSAGAALAAAREVAAGKLANAFVAARPPGHHATRDHSMGFCLVNNVAVAAHGLQAEGLAERVLIVDWDVHHGNGTQEIFEADPSVFFLSLHQSPHYPYTGDTGQTGVGAGKGFTMNVPLPAGTPAPTYRSRFEEALDRSLSRFTPDFVLVSAGFDVMAGDPLGSMTLEPADLAWMTRKVMEAADRACAGRAVVTLEGGYAPKRTAEGVVAVVRALAGA